MKKALIILLILIIISSSSFAQKDIVIEKTVNDYSEELLEKDQNCEIEIRRYLDYLKEKPMTLSKRNLVKKILRVKEGTTELFNKENISLGEQKLIDARFNFDDFYPFCQKCSNTKSKVKKLKSGKIEQTNNLIEEITFYDIDSTDLIAEIGFGNGLMTEILSKINKNNDFYAIEIDKQKVEISNLIFQNKKNIISRIGQEKSCGLEDLEIDLIIIRNSLHHFSYKEEMLNSIYDSLQEDGRIIMLEQFKDEKENLCHEAMYKQEYLQLMTDHGFKIIETQIVNNGMELFKLKLK